MTYAILGSGAIGTARTPLRRQKDRRLPRQRERPREPCRLGRGTRVESKAGGGRGGAAGRHCYLGDSVRRRARCDEGRRLGRPHRRRRHERDRPSVLRAARPQRPPIVGGRRRRRLGRARGEGLQHASCGDPRGRPSGARRPPLAFATRRTADVVRDRDWGKSPRLVETSPLLGGDERQRRDRAVPLVKSIVRARTRWNVRAHRLHSIGNGAGWKRIVWNPAAREYSCRRQF
jgi:hypothetical protein